MQMHLSILGINWIIPTDQMTHAGDSKASHGHPNCFKQTDVIYRKCYSDITRDSNRQVCDKIQK